MHDYYDCDSEFPTLGNLQQPKHQNPSTLFDHGMYTYDPIPLPQFKTHEVISLSKILNIEQSDSTDNISLSELIHVIELLCYNWRFFIDVFDACYYYLLMFFFCLFQY